VDKLVSIRRHRPARLVTAICLVGGLVGGAASPAAASGPNLVAQWNKIAEDTVFGSGAAQIEGMVYMSYTQAAVYDAVVAIDGGYAPYGSPITAPAGASAEAAIVQAAYETLANSFPPSAATLLTARDASLLGIAAGQPKIDGIDVGHRAALEIIALRTGDGRQTPIGSTSLFPTKTPGPGVWRLTPPAYLPPQIPWAGSMTPFVLKSADQFLPPPPPSLSSATWVADFNEMKAMGQDSSTLRTPAETATAKFYTANIIRQWNRLVRDVAASYGLGLLQTARLAAMINVVGADAGIAVMNAKYHYLFWRPVTAIDPTSVKPAGDGYGPVPGFDDGNPATVEEVGWRSLITTPNHPEYPAAHGTITSSIAEVLSNFLGTNRINVDIHGFDPAGAAGNLDAVHHFNRANDLRAEIVNARLWGGVHYRTSTEAGVALGRSVAKYDLRHAFDPLR
jgi:VCPO second helical-bundle domain